MRRPDVQLRLIPALSQGNAGFDDGPQAACVALAGVLGVLVMLRRDLASPKLEALHDECLEVFRWLSDLDIEALAAAGGQSRERAARLLAASQLLGDLAGSAAVAMDAIQ